MRRSPYGERGLKYHPDHEPNPTNRRSPYGERGLKSRTPWDGPFLSRRSPYGERGLKFAFDKNLHLTVMSLSLRRAWIEIYKGVLKCRTRLSRSPYGERGLKYPICPMLPALAGRSPYGERGLKSSCLPARFEVSESLSLRRAWIEIVPLERF